MKKRISRYTIIMLTLFTLLSCSKKIVQLTRENLKTVNREIVAIDKDANTVILNNKAGDGMAMIEGINFDVGTIELEMKGENIQQKSFVGFAFNIQNDSTYEAVYFRPFNFQADEKIRREHSIQYIYHPKHNWRFLRNNYKGKFEADFPRRPAPNEWFKILIKIDNNRVHAIEGNQIRITICGEINRAGI
ncbi:MAG: hypothetical protein IPM36_09385 [Lewinellaceae bacterium]|nr:hypothetical protein [Lewinellaceae bacterium]